MARLYEHQKLQELTCRRHVMHRSIQRDFLLDSGVHHNAEKAVEPVTPARKNWLPEWIMVTFVKGQQHLAGYRGAVAGISAF
jgi:hypothetical protein